MKITDKIVTSITLPQQTNVLWHNPETGELKMFGNKGWEVVGGAPGEGPGEGSNSNSAVIPITYTELVKLRDNKQLIPGLFYKIIDYYTSVDPILTGYKSANHLFDIVVLAIDRNTLATQAHAARHEGDIYFENSDLHKWVLHYTLDNVNWSSTGKTVLDFESQKLILESDLQVLSEIKELIIQSVYEMYNLDGYFYINDESCTTPEDFLTSLFNTYKYIAYDEYYEYVYLLNDISINNTMSMYAYEYGYFYTVEDSLLNVIQSQPGTGCITYMEDEYHNSAYYDFKNILMARYTDFELCKDIDFSLIKKTDLMQEFKRWGCHDNSNMVTNINYKSIQWYYTLLNVTDECDDTTCEYNRGNRFVITSNHGTYLPNIVILTVNYTPYNYFINNSYDLTLGSHMNGTFGTSYNGTCFIDSSHDIIEHLPYSGGNSYANCLGILNMYLNSCNFSCIDNFIGACHIAHTRLTGISNTTLVASVYWEDRLEYSLVVGLNNVDVRQSSLFSNPTSPKIVTQNATNNGIKIIDFATL